MKSDNYRITSDDPSLESRWLSYIYDKDLPF